MTKQIPNIFTLLNLFLGCIAIVFALQTENISIYVSDDLSTHYNIPEKISIAAYFIFAAAVILNEALLMIQGVAAITYTSIPFINEMLLGTACLLFTGALLMVLTRKNILQK